MKKHHGGRFSKVEGRAIFRKKKRLIRREPKVFVLLLYLFVYTPFVFVFGVGVLMGGGVLKGCYGTLRTRTIDERFFSVSPRGASKWFQRRPMVLFSTDTLAVE